MIRVRSEADTHHLNERSPPQHNGDTHHTLTSGNTAGRSPALIGVLHEQLGNQQLQSVLSGHGELEPITRGAMAMEIAGIGRDSGEGIGGNQGMLAAMRRARSAVTPPMDFGVRHPRSGQVLPTDIRERMERAFGHDFSGVRIHLDAQAATDAEQMHAKAFTIGREISFGAGQWTPQTREGERLIAHELTHVVQHDEGRIPTHLKGVSKPTDTHEQEAYANETVILDRLDALIEGQLTPDANDTQRSDRIDTPLPSVTEMMDTEGIDTANKTTAITPTSGANTIYREELDNTAEQEQTSAADPIEAYQSANACFLPQAQLDLLNQIHQLGAEEFAVQQAGVELSENRETRDTTRPVSGETDFQGIRTSEQKNSLSRSGASGPIQVPGTNGLESRPEDEGFQKKITLTFDDGPDVINGTTDRILDILLMYKEERNLPIRATFFIASERVTAPEKYGLGEDARNEAERLLSRIRDEGHIVANHAYEHKLDVEPAKAEPDIYPDHQTSTTDARVTEALINEYQDPFTPSYFRFPGGAANMGSIANLEEQGLASVGWNIDSQDYRYDNPDTPRDPERYLQSLIESRDTNQGGIVLMHDGFREPDIAEETQFLKSQQALTEADRGTAEAERAQDRQAHARTRGRGFTADNLEAFIENSLAAGYTFVGLDDPDAFPTTNAYARACDPLPFIRRDVFAQMTQIQDAIWTHSTEVQDTLLPHLLDALHASVTFSLDTWEDVDGFTSATLAYLNASMSCEDTPPNDTIPIP
ncbi:MAG: DUF4157 domain-containing protein [Myxococcota bacterium]